MPIDSKRYVLATANAAPADPQAQADLSAAAQAGAIAGDIAGRAAGAEAGAAAGTEVASQAGATAGAEAGAIAGAQAGNQSGATAGAAAGSTAGTAAATAVVALKADKTTTVAGGGLVTGGGTLASNRTLTVTAASQAEAEAGVSTAVAMTPLGMSEFFEIRTTTFTRTLLTSVSADAALVTLGAVSLASLAGSAGSALVGWIQAGIGAVTRTAEDKAREVFSVKDFGALGNAQEATVNVTGASTTVSRTSGATFVAGDVGKTIALPGAGVAGANLTTTIATYVSASSVTVTVAPSTSVTGGQAVFGTDDTVSIQKCIDAAILNNRTPGAGSTSRKIFFPAGRYLHSGLSFGTGALTQVTMQGDGEGQTYLVCTADNGPHFTTPNSTVWGWRVSDMTARWTTPANASKTLRAFFTFQASGMFNSVFERIRCGNGHYVYNAINSGDVWGCRLVAHSFFNMSGGFSDLTGGTGEPNMRIEQVYGSCQSCVGPIFKMPGATCQYDNVELNNLDLGPEIINDGSGGNHIIGHMGLEIGTWANSGRTLFNVPNSTVIADYIYFMGDTNPVTQPTYVFGTSGIGRCLIKQLDAVAQVSGAGGLYFAKSGQVIFDRAPRLNGAGVPTPYGSTVGLGNIGSSTANDTLWCNEWGDASQPRYNADANLTLTYADLVAQIFRTSLTTDRTVTLPASGNNLFGGRTFQISKLTTGGGGALLIKTSGGTTLATIPNGSMGQVTVMFNRSISGGPSNTWEVTDYEIRQTFFDGSATYDPPALASGQRGPTQTLAVTGAALGDYVAPSFSLALQDVQIAAWVSAASTVSYYFYRPAALLAGSATYDPPSIAPAGTTTTNVTVTGAVLGDDASASFGASLTGLVISAYVSAADTVTVVLFNPTIAVVDLASGTLRATVRPAATVDLSSGTLRVRVAQQ